MFIFNVFSSNRACSIRSYAAANAASHLRSCSLSLPLRFRQATPSSQPSQQTSPQPSQQLSPSPTDSESPQPTPVPSPEADARSIGGDTPAPAEEGAGEGKQASTGEQTYCSNQDQIFSLKILEYIYVYTSEYMFCV